MLEDTLSLLFLTIIFFGAFFIIFAAVGRYKRIDITQNSEETEATVIRIYKQQLYCEYRVDEKNYKSSLPSLNPYRVFVGDKIRILYHRDKPKRIIIANYDKSYALIETVLFILGSVLVIGSTLIFTGVIPLPN